MDLKNIEDTTNTTEPIDIYDIFLDKLKNKFNIFLKKARDGKTKKITALDARKMSLELRQDLKDFRELSISNDKS